MRFLIATTASLQLFHVFANAQSISNETSSACPQQGGVHIIVARGSNEPLGYGQTGAVKDAVLGQIPGSTAEFVVYPALINAYFDSETSGVLAAREAINAYIANCPGLPLVTMGYSQGAQVTTDALIGRNVKGFPANASLESPLPDSTLSRVAAVILTGDPTFVRGESFHVGNATKDGLFPRQNVNNFNATGLASRVQSYCDDGDRYCASGSIVAVHGSYVRVYGVDAANFVVNAVATWYVTAGNSTSVSPSASASARPAPSASAPSRSQPASSSSSSTASTTASASARASTGAAAALDVAGARIGIFAASLFALLL